jgi:hypothetical protein
MYRVIESHETRFTVKYHAIPNLESGDPFPTNTPNMNIMDQPTTDKMSQQAEQENLCLGDLLDAAMGLTRDLGRGSENIEGTENTNRDDQKHGLAEKFNSVQREPTWQFKKPQTPSELITVFRSPSGIIRGTYTAKGQLWCILKDVIACGRLSSSITNTTKKLSPKDLKTARLVLKKGQRRVWVVSIYGIAHTLATSRHLNEHSDELKDWLRRVFDTIPRLEPTKNDPNSEEEY